MSKPLLFGAAGALVLALSPLACTDEGDGTGNGNGNTGPLIEGTGSYLPLAVGNSWTYRVTHPIDGVFMKVNTVEKMEAVGGMGPHKDTQALYLKTVKRGGASAAMDQTESWQGTAGDRIVRYRERSYRAGTNTVDLEEHWNPPRLRLDQTLDRLAAGAAWTEEYAETKLRAPAPTTTNVTDEWKVEAVDEVVSVPAGRFKCIRVKKTGTSSEANKTWWFARGIGKVKEEGGQREELVMYAVVKS